MLTLTETIDAIKAIDTDPDVILGACRRIASPQENNPSDDPIKDLVLKITNICEGVRPSTVQVALITALAANGAVTVRPGTEVGFIKAVNECFIDFFVEMRQNAFKEKLCSNPNEARNELLALLKAAFPEIKL